MPGRGRAYPHPQNRAMAPPVLALKNARLRIGQQELFAGLDAMLAHGDRVCLVGRNGSGKSTLLRVLAGLTELDSGEVFTQPRVTIAYLPQEPQLPPAATLADLVLLGLPAAERGEAARYRADILLAELGMEPERAPEGLSGGEIRRVSLAQALVAEPDVLLLDEPTNHLDLPTIEWLEERLAGVRRLVRRHQPRPPLPDPPLDPDLVARPRHACAAASSGYAGFEDWSGQVLAAEEAEYPAPRQAAGGRDALAAPRRHRPPQAQHGPAAQSAGPAPAAPPADRTAGLGQAARRLAGASAAGW